MLDLLYAMSAVKFLQLLSVTCLEHRPIQLCFICGVSERASQTLSFCEHNHTVVLQNYESFLLPNFFLKIFKLILTFFVRDYTAAQFKYFALFLCEGDRVFNAEIVTS